MMEWIGDHLNHVVGWVLGIFTTLIGFGWKARGYSVRIEKTESDIGTLKELMENQAEAQKQDSERIRKLEDAQIRTVILLDQLPKLVNDCQKNTDLLITFMARFENARMGGDSSLKQSNNGNN